MAAEIIYEAREGETPLEDISGLKIKIPQITRQQLDVAEAENIQKALLKYLNVKSISDFDVQFFRKLHQDMFGDVWEWAGEYRTTQTNLGRPAGAIAQDLIILQKDIVEFPHNLEGAVILHHRAVQIHPFKNGNGRWSRILSGLWLEKNTGEQIRWPAGMEVESPIRTEYIAALKKADGLDYSDLIKLHQQFIKDKA